MAEVRRTRQSVSPDEGRQSARRQRLTGGEERGRRGGGGRGEGGGVKPLSRRSFLAIGDYASAPSSPVREDSPLLGTSERASRSLAKRAFAGDDSEEDEKKEVAEDWGDVEGERAAAARHRLLPRLQSASSPSCATRLDWAYPPQRSMVWWMRRTTALFFVILLHNPETSGSRLTVTPQPHPSSVRRPRQHQSRHRANYRRERLRERRR